METYQEMRAPAHLGDDLRRAGVQRVQGVAGARLLRVAVLLGDHLGGAGVGRAAGKVWNAMGSAG